MDPAIVAKLGEIGFLAGWELDTVSYCLVMEELGVADSSVRGIVSVNVGLVGKTIRRWGTDEQREEWIPKLGSGEALGCYALTEPRRGLGPGSLATRAERDGGDWLLSGQKIFITLGTWAKVALVFARTDRRGSTRPHVLPRADGRGGLRGAADQGQARACARRTPASCSSSARVPDSARLGDEGDGFKVAMSALDNGRISLAAGCVGIARGCLDASVGYARTGRSSTGRSLGSSSCRSCSPTSRSRPTRPACSPGALPCSRIRASATRSSRRSPSTRERGLGRAANAAVQVHGGYGLRRRVPRRQVSAGCPRDDVVRGHEPDPS